MSKCDKGESYCRNKCAPQDREKDYLCINFAKTITKQLHHKVDH